MSRDLLRSSYDRDAANYDARFGPIQRPKYERLIGDPETQLGGFERVLDLGCGTGLLLEYLERRDQSPRTLVGLDLSHMMLERAQARGMTVLQADAARIPLRDDAFDAVVCFTMLRIFESDEAPVFKEIVRVLRPGGLAIISVLTRQLDAVFHSELSASGLRAERVMEAGQDTGFICRI